MTRSPALTSLFVLASSFALACNDDGSNGDEALEIGDGDGDSTGDGDGSETDDSESSTSSETSTTDTGESTTETTDDTTDSTTTEDTTDSTTGGPPDDSMYSAVAFPGGLDRVIITRVDPDGPSCSQMVLVLPGFDMWQVDLPAMWAVEQVRSWDSLDCDLMVTPDSLGEGGVGVIEFLGTDAFDLYPCALSIDVEVDMDTDPPSSMIWWTEFVMVEGVNCG